MVVENRGSYIPGVIKHLVFTYIMLCGNYFLNRLTTDKVMAGLKTA